MAKRVLGNRYEIGAPLGEGGMARVFKATDRTLGRTVAVKILAPQHAKDGQFVARFRREAQAAAALNHPNVVSVFDSGSQGNVHYIVMEYIDGTTLADMIRNGGALTPERVVEIAEDVCRALSEAHTKGIVHRDIKPGNIMITPAGEVKVMDFGIARATSGESVTQTAAVLGTASYLSPEQAQGMPVDGRSDIYSLGCVLYEMLTRRPPFTGETPVSVAYKHVNEQPALPSSLNPDVTPALEAVVMKSLSKNPANRYQTAGEMTDDLERILQGLPVEATPVLKDATATQVISRPDQTGVLPPMEPRRRTGLVVLLILLLAGVLGAAAFFLVRALLAEPEIVTVPNVVGSTEEQARERLEERGLDVRVEEQFRPPEDLPGLVFRQLPRGGKRVEEGSEVKIFVSQGVRQTQVPDLTGLTVDEARNALEEEGLVLGDEIPGASILEEGRIFDQDPDPLTEVDEGTEVDVFVSTGPEQTAVPNVICLDRDEAQQRIEERDLVYVEEGFDFSDECAPDTIATQDPQPGELVEPGSEVRVTISEGPEPGPSPFPFDGDGDG